MEERKYDIIVNMEGSIYGPYRPLLDNAMLTLASKIEKENKKRLDRGEDKLYEHLIYRVKSEESMREKLSRKALPVTTESALSGVFDAIGLRIVCPFVDDVYTNAALIHALPGVTVIREKDYIKNAKSNGYRSYHMILKLSTEERPLYAEVQLRTIAMDTWAALEHELKYKKDIADSELIIAELRRCANELAACDISMQTLRSMIRGR